MKALLLKGAIWIGVTRLAVNAIGFLSTIVLARLLLPQDFGVVAIASSAAAIFAAVSELSLAQALVQHDDPQDDHFDTAFTLDAIRGVVLAGVISILAWPFSVAFEEPRLVGLMVCFGGASLIGCLANPRLALLERRLEFRQWIILSGGEKLVGFIIAALIAFLFRSYWALAVGAIASQTMRVAASYLLVRYRPRLSVSRYRELLSFSLWLLFAQAVQAVSWRADPLLYAAFLPTNTVGFFSVGSRISSLAVGEVLQPISQVLFPAFSQIKNEPARLREAYLRAQGLLCLIAMPTGFGLAATADQIVPIVLGEVWAPAVPVIQLLAIAAVLQRTNELNAIAMATSNTKALFFRDIRGLFIRIPLIVGGLTLAPFMDIDALIGALAGHTTSSCINALLNIRLVSQISLMTAREQFALIWRPLLASALMSSAVLWFSDFGDQGVSLTNRLVALVVSIIVGITVYAASVGCLWLVSGRPESAEAELGSLVTQKVSVFFRRA